MVSAFWYAHLQFSPLTVNKLSKCLCFFVQILTNVLLTTAAATQMQFALTQSAATSATVKPATGATEHTVLVRFANMPLNHVLH